jgi:ABC-type cobalamin/Fe3+-siderophores transport system ATPase subunit
MADSEILILDEPTPALDLKNQIVILDWIVGLSQEDGLTVVMTTNHPRMAAEPCRHWFLSSSRHAYKYAPRNDGRGRCEIIRTRTS